MGALPENLRHGRERAWYCQAGGADLAAQVELYEGENYIGCLEKELGWFKPKYNIDFNGWHVEGDFPGWDYTITKPVGETVATVSKELLQWTDTYVLDIVDPADALHVLMFVLAIDAEKCSAK